MRWTITLILYVCTCVRVPRIEGSGERGGSGHVPAPVVSSTAEADERSAPSGLPPPTISHRAHHFPSASCTNSDGSVQRL